MPCCPWSWWSALTVGTVVGNFNLRLSLCKGLGSPAELKNRAWTISCNQSKGRLRLRLGFEDHFSQDRLCSKKLLLWKAPLCASHCCALEHLRRPPPRWQVLRGLDRGCRRRRIGSCQCYIASKRAFSTGSLNWSNLMVLEESITNPCSRGLTTRSSSSS